MFASPTTTTTVAAKLLTCVSQQLALFDKRDGEDKYSLKTLYDKVSPISLAFF